MIPSLLESFPLFAMCHSMLRHTESLFEECLVERLVNNADTLLPDDRLTAGFAGHLIS